MLRIVCIVEGHGEVEAVPILIRRIVRKLDVPAEVHVPRPIRIPRHKLTKSGELERATELAARQLSGKGAIFVLLDSDENCPAKLGPALLKRARESRKDIAVGVVLAKQEYEAWFLAAAESLRNQRGLPGDLTPPEDPEAIRGAKEWLSSRMEGSGTYSPTLDQPALSACFDLTSARKSDSFDKCFRTIERLIGQLTEE